MSPAPFHGPYPRRGPPCDFEEEYDDLARTVGILLLTLSPFSPSQRAQQSTEVLELRNGRWFDATRFEERTIYVVNARFELARPKRIDRVVDLSGGYAPPIGRRIDVDQAGLRTIRPDALWRE